MNTRLKRRTHKAASRKIAHSLFSLPVEREAAVALNCNQDPPLPHTGVSEPRLFRVASLSRSVMAVKADVTGCGWPTEDSVVFGNRPNG